MIHLMHDYLEQTASRYADKDAIIQVKSNITYRELLDQVNRFSGFLQANQFKKNDRIVISLGNCIETIVAYYGALKAGLIPCIINPEQPESKIAYILQDAGASAFLYCSENIIKLDHFRHREAAIRLAVEIQDSLPGLPRPQKEWARNDEDTNLIGWSDIINQSYSIQPINIIDADIAAIIYTSGSTGEPKGVTLTHRNMVTACHSINGYLENTDQEKILCALPLSFDYGLYQVFMSIAKGATLILENNFLLPLSILKRIETHRITALPCVPSMVTMLDEAARIKQYDLSSVRYVTNTGAALSGTHIDLLKTLLPKARIFSMYGLTECKRCTYLPPDEIHHKPNSVGKAIPNTEIYVIDEQGQRLPPFVVGQLIVRGSTVMRGYWNKPEATAKRLKEGEIPGEKVLHTGDYGYLDNEGYFYFQGRIDEMLKSRGIKVSPKEIEDLLYALNDIREAAVIGADNKTTRETEIYLFTSLHEQSVMTTQSILAYCKSNLEKEKVPHHIAILNALPKGHNGKIDKKQLKERVMI